MSSEIPLLELHKRSAAVMGDYFGVPLPARYSNFADEYRTAREAVALADTNFHALFSFSGPDRQRYVNAVLSSNIRDLQPGQGEIGLLLTPQGHIVAEVETYVLADKLLAVSHALVRVRTFATFDKFIIMDDVKLEDVTESMGRISLVGPRAALVVSTTSDVDLTSMPPYAHTEATVGSIPCRVIRRERCGLPGADLLAPREHLAALWTKLEQEVCKQGGAPVGMEALNAIRLEHGLPWFGYDYDENNIPHEAALERSHINYEKGCYTGQEIVERVRSRGHVNRRLTLLHFFSDAPPAPETKIFAAGAIGEAERIEAGHVTSAARSPMLGHAIGLGYVRREHSAIGTQLDASGVRCEVIDAPSQGAAHS